MVRVVLQDRREQDRRAGGIADLVAHYSSGEIDPCLYEQLGCGSHEG
jgi:hypothetical protein